MIEVTKIVLGDIYTNTYIIKDEATSALAVVDPACKSERLVELINELGGDLRYILLTHGHFDHIGGVKFVKEHFDVPVLIGKDELTLLNSNALNGSALHNISVDKVEVDRALVDNDTITLGESTLRFITTPGHTAGSGCYIVDDCIFSGDTLFYRSVGRTDFPTSSPADMAKSLIKFRDLQGDYNVLPGHDISTTLSAERKYNPYMR